MLRYALAALAVCLALVGAVACGDDDSDSQTAAPSQEVCSSVADVQQAADSLRGLDPANTTNTRSRPPSRICRARPRGWRRPQPAPRARTRRRCRAPSNGSGRPPSRPPRPSPRANRPSRPLPPWAPPWSRSSRPPTPSAPTAPARAGPPRGEVAAPGTRRPASPGAAPGRRPLRCLDEPLVSTMRRPITRCGGCSKGSKNRGYGRAGAPRVMGSARHSSVAGDPRGRRPRHGRSRMSTDAYEEGSAWSGWVIFAAIVMFTIGAIDIIQGIAALAKDEVYLVTDSGLLVTTDFTTWGWTLLIWGIVLILGGRGALLRQGVGPLVRDRRRRHQPHRPDRLVPGLPAVEPGRHRARDRGPVRAHGGLEGGEG